MPDGVVQPKIKPPIGKKLYRMGDNLLTYAEIRRSVIGAAREASRKVSLFKRSRRYG